MDFADKNKRIHAEKYTGNNYQIGGTRRYTLTDGMSNGCKCIDVRTGSGFEFTVALDRGMDISLASYGGINLVYLTENMEANPAFYDQNGDEWLKTFSAGLLTTCGPAYLGPACTDEGEKLGLHGKWSALPAKQVCDLTDYENGTIEITGKLTDSRPFGHKLKIERKIKSEFGKSFVVINDSIKNEGAAPVPLNLLYHINFGYPFLDENIEIHVPSVHFCGYDEYSQKRIGEQKGVKSPDGNNMEKNYMHTFGDNGDTVTAWVHNKNILGGLAVYIEFDSKTLPYMTQWVFENIKDYVLALEPSNVPCESRNILRQKGLLKFINPGETLDFSVKIGIVQGNESISKTLCK